MKETTGQRLKQLRLNRKLTSKQVCEELKRKQNFDLSVGKYNEIESDVEKDFGYKVFKELSLFFEVSTDYLFGLEELKSNKDEVKIINKYIGLNDSAINSLRTMIMYNEAFKRKQRPLIDIANALIANKLFFEMCCSVSSIIDEKHYLSYIQKKLKESQEEESFILDKLEEHDDNIKFSIWKSTEIYKKLIDIITENYED